MGQSHTALIGAALGWGAQISSTEQGPVFMQKFLESENLPTFENIIYPSVSTQEGQDLDIPTKIKIISAFDQQLAQQVVQNVYHGQCPVVIGGDHSMALGTWGGMISALQAQREFGLIWMDAHMDAHTFATTPSKAIHGMPVACLLGYGDPALVNVAIKGAKIKSEHLVLLGVRSFEDGEAALLKRLNVRVYFMDEINKRGFAAVFAEAIQQVTQGTKGFGVSLDLDVFDPNFVPGVGSPSPGGLHPRDFLTEMSALNHPLFKGFEIAEFNPVLDRDNKTAMVIRDILKTLAQERAGG